MTQNLNRRSFSQALGETAPMGRRAFRRHVRRTRGWRDGDPRIDVAYAAYLRGLHGRATTKESNR
ncbi:hypothetical protein [Gordonia neofelifaecis]|uniref:Uncharacterized protein n=1 Tax=Gordonia neofelifaecis NRRL B-59395 TaxID=644548 RepID=F1YE76_9ACTN|nr:hypothetical protein [Gordonia neofelifaecis]EGD57166.1 hypothetical protein SCNU_02290 [Gordonia neofelifaecis NRRL B-59395]